MPLRRQGADHPGRPARRGPTGKPRSKCRHGRRRPTIHEFACRTPGMRLYSGCSRHHGFFNSRRLMRGGWVYIMTDEPNGTLYIGVTSDLPRRAWQHREGLIDGFTKRYGLTRLVFFERHDDIRTAIQREKNLKRWPRAW